MSAVFEYQHTVVEGEIDMLGRASNIAFLAWMQAAALAHTAAQGWPAQRYQELGCGWVVRSHAIEYHRPAAAGDQLVVRTWVATMRKVTSLRRYRIYRRADQALLAEAQTNWAFINYATGQPTRVPAALCAAFTLVPDDGQPAAG